MTNSPISVRVSDDEREFCQKGAERHGMNLAELLRTGGNLMAGFDPAFWQQIKGLSKRMHIPEFLIIQNLMLDVLAKIQAEKDVLGLTPSSDGLFIITESGPITGKEFYDHRYQWHSIQTATKQVRGLLEDKKKLEEHGKSLAKDRQEQLDHLQKQLWEDGAVNKPLRRAEVTSDECADDEEGELLG
jgi:hypothetical protein